MLKTSTLILCSLFILVSAPAKAAQLSYGKYFGTLQMDGQTEAMAVSMDAFVTQINDPTVYPALEVILRVNLGGFFSSEYVTYDFYDPTFNFERGILSLNDPKNELSGNLTVTTTDDQTILEGPVVHRLTNSKGMLRLVLNMDGSTPSFSEFKGPFVTVIKGEYEGSCGADKALLQIETGRSMGTPAPGNALKDYSITGRIGYTNGPLCEGNGQSKYCGQYPYSTGTYSPFANRITMQGPLGTLDCSKSKDELRCNVFGYNKRGSCKLARKGTPAAAPTQAAQEFFLNVPEEDMAPLPAPNPPDNADLVNSLDGEYYGFLHHENRNVYQLMEMGIIASTSTENPHIENQVIVNPTILLRLGASWDDNAALTLIFPQRIFDQTQGFSFQAADNDYFAVIGRWRKGYVSGVMYSRAYGRIGSFELQKKARPAPSTGMELLFNPKGDFKGPSDASPARKNKMDVSIEIPNQVSGPAKAGIPLLGRYSGPGQMTMFDASSLDLNTGALSFLIVKAAGDRLITGSMPSATQLKLIWPPGPALGAPMDEYKPLTFLPKRKN